MENEKRKPKSADGVRIIGAKEAGGAVDDQTRSFGPAAAGPGGDDERDWEGDDGAWMTADPDEASEAPDASSSEFSAPLPHWADRPEPRGTEGGGEDTAAWTSFAGQGPRWRDQPGDWGDAHVGDPSVLADESVRVGALDPNRRGTADQMRFDDEDLKPAGEGRGAPAASVPVDDGLESVSLPRSSSSLAGSEAPGAAPERGGRTAATGSDQTVGGQRPPPRPVRSGAPDLGIPGDGGRDMGAAIGTGVAVAAGALLVFFVGKSAGAAVLVVVALGLAVMEFYTALRQRAFHPAIPVGLVGTVAVAGTAYWKGSHGVLIALLLTVLVSFLWYLFRVEPDRPAVNIAVTLLGVVYIGLLGATANLILKMPNGTGRGVLMGAIAGTVGYDVVGFLLGSRIGKLPLAPEISPNKTVEGLVAGMAGAFLTCVVVFGVIGVEPWDRNKAIALGLVVAIAAPLGDLAESMIKRDLGIKDMGSLLPGHGGVLDRIDAMLFVIPAVYFLALQLNFL